MSDPLPRQEWLALAVLAAVLAALIVGALATDLPGASHGQFWSDGATYYAMAWSLALDGDLRYERDDLLRVRQEFPGGPQGIFLKRSSGGLILDGAAGFPWIRRVRPDERRIYFAKALAYPLAAAPLVRLFGTRGLLLLNALSLGTALALGYSEARRRVAPFRALALTAAVFLFGVTPVYLVWPQPELLNLALVCAALVAWRRECPLLSAVLFGIATYSKPTNLLVALPLGSAPLFPTGRLALGAGLRESARRGLALAGTTLLLYGMNAAVTGEWNYQGGERKTFYGSFPFDPPHVTFGNSGIWMTTEHLGPVLPEAGEEARAKARGVIERPAAELREAFVRNLGYFWIGRFAGVVAYFFPVALGALLFVLLGQRDKAGWLALAALVLSSIAYVALIPDNWYGGGGTVGNRYLLNLLPLALFFVPRGREWLVAAAGAVAAVVFVGPALAAPVEHSLHPWLLSLRAPVKLFPLELTMLNDLGFCSDAWRKKQPFGDPEGDPRKGRRPSPSAYWLYFPDDGTYGKEIVAGQEGFWLRRGQSAQLVLRALEPVERVVLRLNGGPEGDIVKIRSGGVTATLPLLHDEVLEQAFPPGRPYSFYLSYVYTLSLESLGSEDKQRAPRGDTRQLGAFVQLALKLAPFEHPPVRLGAVSDLGEGARAAAAWQ